MRTTSLLVVFVILSMVLLAPGCSAEEGNGWWDLSKFIPKAKEGANQKWQTKMTNNKSSKTTHDTESSNVHHTGQQTWPGNEKNGNGE